MTLQHLEAIEFNACYVRLTGHPSTLTLNRIYDWQVWHGYANPNWGLAELELVIRFIQRHMQDMGKQSRGYTANSLRFQNLIRDRENFESLVGIARAEARVKQPTARDEALRATGRAPMVSVETKTAEQVMSQHAKMASLLKSWKETNL